MLQTFAKKDWFCIVFHNVFGSPASKNFGFTMCFLVCVGSCLQKHNFVNVFFGFGWFLFSKHLFFNMFLVLLGRLSFKASVFQHASFVLWGAVLQKHISFKMLFCFWGGSSSSRSSSSLVVCFVVLSFACCLDMGSPGGGLPYIYIYIYIDR